jgi:hypothetical protein
VPVLGLAAFPWSTGKSEMSQRLWFQLCRRLKTKQKPNNSNLLSDPQCSHCFSFG